MSLTWDTVDATLVHAQNHDKLRLRVLTAERRYFGLMSAYDYMHSRLTMKEGGGYGWCPFRAEEALTRLAEIIKDAHKLWIKLDTDFWAEKCINKKTGECQIEASVPCKVLTSRHTEVTDPDKKIWRELYRKNLVDDKVVKAYESVKDMVPDEPIGEARHLRCGEVKDATTTTTRPCSVDAELYNKYMRSDELSLPSNELSKLHEISYQLVTGVYSNVSRRLYRYLEIEKKKPPAGGARYPNNYIRGLILAQQVSSLFGAAFAGMQAYQYGFALSATMNLGVPSVVRSLALKATGGVTNTLPLTKVRYPSCQLHPSVSCNGVDEKRLLTIVRFVPNRSNREALTRITNPIAEASPRGPLATWLATTMSNLLCRRVSVQYTQLLLANWAARHPTRDDLLRRFASVFGVTFDRASGLVIPMVGFGSGMTRQKLAVYTTRLLVHGISPNVTTGHKLRTNKPLDFKHKTLEEVATGFFKNTAIVREGHDNCNCSCHNVAGLTGMKFEPCPARRIIKEKVYADALSAEPVLSFTFGVCGYQHPLSVNSETQTERIKNQRIKERLLFEQWNTAIAINHWYFAQFLIPRRLNTGTISPAEKRLMDMSSRSVTRLARGLRSTQAIARVIEDICVKFNTRMFVQSLPANIFLRTRVGLLVKEHARNSLTTALRMRDYDESTVPLMHAEALELARACICGKGYSTAPVIETGLKRAWRYPFEGLGAELIYPKRDEYINNAAEVCGDPISAFWLEKTPSNNVDALVARSVVPEYEMHDVSRRRLLIEDESIQKQLEQKRRDNERAFATGKPRKMDTKPWSIKNTGQSGRKTTEFVPNSLITISSKNKDIVLVLVDSQDQVAKTDIQFPIERNYRGKTFLAAPDIAPLYRTNGNVTNPVQLKHHRRSYMFGRTHVDKHRI